MSDVNPGSASAERKSVEQPSAAGDTPSNQRASQQLECIVTNDSDEEF